MSRFASKKLRQIDLGNDEWVKIPTGLSYSQVLSLTSHANEAEVSKAMLIECIKEWNLKDEDGVLQELTADNIMNLDIITIQEISKEILPLLTNDQDKKK
jgi:hypothetical protein